MTNMTDDVKKPAPNDISLEVPGMALSSFGPCDIHQKSQEEKVEAVRELIRRGVQPGPEARVCRSCALAVIMTLDAKRGERNG